jgi:hypothetical protein
MDKLLIFIEKQVYKNGTHFGGQIPKGSEVFLRGHPCHSAFSASAVFPRLKVAPSRGGSYLPRLGIAFSRDKKGLSRVRFAHSRAGSCFSALGEALSRDRRGPSRLLGCQIGD